MRRCPLVVYTLGGMSKGNSSEKFVDYYALLGAEYGAEGSELKRAYLLRAKEAHPDAGGSNEAMQQLNLAYRTLTDETKRSAYNKLYGLYNRVALDDLELKEDDYDVPAPSDTSAENTGLEDFFVDQLYAEYYEPKKESKWKGKFKRK